MLNDRREEQKIIEVVQSAHPRARTALFPKRSDYLIFWIIGESARSLGGTVCCSILSFRAQSMSPTFRQQKAIEAAHHEVIQLVAG